MSNPIHHINQYTYHQQNVIGEGASGKVYLGCNTKTHQNVAIKVINMNTIDNQVTTYLLNSQKQALLNIRSPYVLHAIEVLQNKQFTYIITDYYQGGTLKQQITIKKNKNNQKTIFQEIQALEILLKLAQGLCAISQKGFIHRDLKTANILFRGNDPIIIDFGYCQNLKGKKPQMYYNVGSPSYMSPEAYKKCQYSQKSDVWSLGVIFYEMIVGVPMDYGMQIKQFFSQIQKPGGLKFNSIIPQCSQMLLSLIFKANPKERISIQQLLKPIEISIRNLKNKSNFNNLDNQIIYRPVHHQVPLKVTKQQHISNKKINQNLAHVKSYEKSFQCKNQSSFDGNQKIFSNNSIHDRSFQNDSDKKILISDDIFHQRMIISNKIIDKNAINKSQNNNFNERMHREYFPQNCNVNHSIRVPKKQTIENHQRKQIIVQMNNQRTHMSSLSPRTKNRNLIQSQKNEMKTSKIIKITNYQNENVRIHTNDDEIISRERKFSYGNDKIISFNSPPLLNLNNSVSPLNSKHIIQNTKTQILVKKKEFSIDKGVLFKSDILKINSNLKDSEYNSKISFFKPWQHNQNTYNKMKTFSDLKQGRKSLQMLNKSIGLDIMNQQQKKKRMFELRRTVSPAQQYYKIESNPKQMIQRKQYENLNNNQNINEESNFYNQNNNLTHQNNNYQNNNKIELINDLKKVNFEKNFNSNYNNSYLNSNISNNNKVTNTTNITTSNLGNTNNYNSTQFNGQKVNIQLTNHQITHKNSNTNNNHVNINNNSTNSYAIQNNNQLSSKYVPFKVSTNHPSNDKKNNQIHHYDRGYEFHQNVMVKKTGINIINHHLDKNNIQANQKNIHTPYNSNITHENNQRNFITITSNQPQNISKPR